MTTVEVSKYVKGIACVGNAGILTVKLDDKGIFSYSILLVEMLIIVFKFPFVI